MKKPEKIVRFMAQERRVPLIVWAALGFGAIAVETAALNTDLSDNWVYVGIYIGILCYSIYAHALLPIATTTALVALRSAVAEGVTGTWLSVFSVTFATLYLLMVVDYIKRRDERKSDGDRPQA